MDGESWRNGDIVSDQLGVKKWEVAEVATGSGKVIGDFPYGIPKTDEIRVQAEPGLIEEFNGVPYYISTKMDGTSVTMYLIDGAFGVCSRNYEIGDDETSPAWKFVHKNNIQEKIQKGAAAISLKNVVVQGEFCGEGIQKNPLKLVICNIENALKKIAKTWSNLLAFTFLKSLFHKLFYGTCS